MNLASAWIIGLLEFADGLVLTIYGWYVFGPRIKRLFTSSRQDVHLRTQALLFKHRRPDVPAQEMIPELQLRCIRAAQTDTAVTCLFINEGQTVMNLRVVADDLPSARIEPSDLLAPQQTGSITLYVPQHEEAAEEIRFEIRYQDTRGRQNEAAYSYRARDGKLIRVPTR